MQPKVQLKYVIISWWRKEYNLVCTICFVYIPLNMDILLLDGDKLEKAILAS